MPKALTREQLEKRKEKAVRFVEDVLGDPDRAQEIADESLDDYAERRHIRLLNPRCKTVMPSKAELMQRIHELEAENDSLNDKLDAVSDALDAGDDNQDRDAGEDEEQDGDDGED